MSLNSPRIFLRCDTYYIRRKIHLRLHLNNRFSYALRFLCTQWQTRSPTRLQAAVPYCTSHTGQQRNIPPEWSGIEDFFFPKYQPSVSPDPIRQSVPRHIRTNLSSLHPTLPKRKTNRRRLIKMTPHTLLLFLLPAWSRLSSYGSHLPTAPVYGYCPDETEASNNALS